MNTQKPEAASNYDGDFLDVQSIFKTIQGEGPFCGDPAIFIRLAGCNIQCPGCDTDYTSRRSLIHIKDIGTKVDLFNLQSLKIKLVVITGGEPLRQNIKNLAVHLLQKGYKIQVETNGLYPPFESEAYEDNVFYVVSPKTPKINNDMMRRANAFKYVLSAKQVSPMDGLPEAVLYNHTKQVCRPPNFSKIPVYLQPMDENCPMLNANNLKAVVKSCLEYGYRLQLQVHKIIGLE